VSFKGHLDSGELITGVTIEEQDTSVLTITGKAVNSSTMTVNEDDAVLAGQGAVCTIAGATIAGGPSYKIKIVATTDGSQTIPGYVIFLVANK
jgi:hypothetical protein